MHTFARNLWTDLTEKRLWPVAVGLVAAIPAAPLLLSGSTDAPVAPATPVAGAAAGAPPLEAAAVSSLADDALHLKPFGAYHDPFRGPRAAATTSTAPVATGSKPAPSAGAVASKQLASGGATAPASRGRPTTTQSAPAPTPTAPAVKPSVPKAPSVKPPVPKAVAAGYRVDLAFGHPGATKPLDDVARLSPLFGAGRPFAIFLGVKDDRKTLLFMMTGDAVPSGDGVCRPTPKDCQILGLRAGQSESFDVTTAAGDVVRYQLDVGRAVTRTAQPAHAATMLSRESHQGRGVLRDAIAAGGLYVGRYRYSERHGVVVKSKPAAAKSRAVVDVAPEAPVPGE